MILDVLLIFIVQTPKMLNSVEQKRIPSNVSLREMLTFKLSGRGYSGAASAFIVSILLICTSTQLVHDHPALDWDSTSPAVLSVLSSGWGCRFLSSSLWSIRAYPFTACSVLWPHNNQETHAWQTISVALCRAPMELGTFLRHAERPQPVIFFPLPFLPPHINHFKVFL